VGGSNMLLLAAKITAAPRLTSMHAGVTPTAKRSKVFGEEATDSPFPETPARNEYPKAVKENEVAIPNYSSYQEAMADLKVKFSLSEADTAYIGERLGQKKAIIFLKDAIQEQVFEDATAVQVALTHALDKTFGEDKISFTIFRSHSAPRMVMHFGPHVSLFLSIFMEFSKDSSQFQINSSGLLQISPKCTIKMFLFDICADIKHGFNVQSIASTKSKVEITNDAFIEVQGLPHTYYNHKLIPLQIVQQLGNYLQFCERKGSLTWKQMVTAQVPAFGVKEDPTDMLLASTENDEDTHDASTCVVYFTLDSLRKLLKVALVDNQFVLPKFLSFSSNGDYPIICNYKFKQYDSINIFSDNKKEIIHTLKFCGLCRSLDCSPTEIKCPMRHLDMTADRIKYHEDKKRKEYKKVATIENAQKNKAKYMSKMPKLI
jgi:hypothetical protein